MSTATANRRLTELRHRLEDLRRRRRRVRMGSAWTALVTALVVTLALAFIADYLLQLRWIERLAVLLMVVLAALWSFRRYTRPLLGVRESELDMALIVERRQKIDSDLVAALQFERAGGGNGFGSPELREAVIDYVADFGKSINVFEGMSHGQFRRRSRWCAAALLVATGACLVYPGHIGAFFNRLLLGSAHYPSATEIVAVRVNDHAVSDEPLPGLPDGAPIRFSVRVGGVIPESAEVRLVSSRSRGGSTLTLQRVAASAAEESVTEFAGTLPRLAEEATVQVFAGDAWTEPISLRVVERPVVSLSLEVTPPEYARSAQKPKGEGARQIAVIEGSRVALAVVCANKSLGQVTVRARDQEFALAPTSPEGNASPLGKPWGLAGSEHPFERIEEPLSFEVRVRDTDGLEPAEPLAGHIRILADRSPRVAAAVVTEKVLPGAKPSVAYGATDDYGLAVVRLKWELVRADGSVEQGEQPIRKRTGNDAEAGWRGKYAFDLKPLKALKGDEVRVAIEAEDWRGSGRDGALVPGKSSASEPIVFQVTDESGVLAGLVEADEKSARQLDGIIQRQLGIGAGP